MKLFILRRLAFRQRTHLLLFVFILCSQFVFSQEENIVLVKDGSELEGTLLMPPGKINCPVVLLISGSGPTDRNGNQEDLENNSLKMVAEELQRAGVASMRYDKRGVSASSGLRVDEYELKIETFSNDVKTWIDTLYGYKRFSKIIVAGHSEGAFLGLLASAKNKKVNAYVSIAGAGRPIDVVLQEQLAHLPNDVKTSLFGMIAKLKKGDTLSNVPPVFYGLLRPSIQPFMISWLQYDPAKEIKKLNVPVLILQGSTDMQVKEKDAQALHAAYPKSKLAIIPNMNHVLKDCDTMDKTLQLKIYSDPVKPLHKDLMNEIIGFVNTLPENTQRIK